MCPVALALKKWEESFLRMTDATVLGCKNLECKQCHRFISQLCKEHWTDSDKGVGPIRFAKAACNQPLFDFAGSQGT